MQIAKLPLRFQSKLCGGDGVVARSLYHNALCIQKHCFKGEGMGDFYTACIFKNRLFQKRPKLFLLFGIDADFMGERYIEGDSFFHRKADACDMRLMCIECGSVFTSVCFIGCSFKVKSHRTIVI